MKILKIFTMQNIVSIEKNRKSKSFGFFDYVNCNYFPVLQVNFMIVEVSNFKIYECNEIVRRKLRFLTLIKA